MNWLSNPEHALYLVLPVNVLRHVGCLIHIPKVNLWIPRARMLTDYLGYFNHLIGFGTISFGKTLWHCCHGCTMSSERDPQRKTRRSVLDNLKFWCPAKKLMKTTENLSEKFGFCPKIAAKTIRIRSRNTVHYTVTFGYALTVLQFSQSVGKFPKDSRLRIISTTVDFLFVERMENIC